MYSSKRPCFKSRIALFISETPETQSKRILMVLIKNIRVRAWSQHFFFKILFIYNSHTERVRQRHRQKQAPCREPDVGFDPRSPGSGPGLKAALNRWATLAAPLQFFYVAPPSSYHLAVPTADVHCGTSVLLNTVGGHCPVDHCFISTQPLEE